MNAALGPGPKWLRGWVTLAALLGSLLGAAPPAATQEGPESPISMHRLIAEVLPAAYPRLTAALRKRAGAAAVCPAVRPDSPPVRLRATETAVIVEGRLPPAPGSAAPRYRLEDRDGDARPDRIECRIPAEPGAPWVIAPPEDDTALTLWYEALAAGLGCLNIGADGFGQAGRGALP